MIMQFGGTKGVRRSEVIRGRLVGEVWPFDTCIGGEFEATRLQDGSTRICDHHIGTETALGQSYGGFESATFAVVGHDTGFQAQKVDPDATSGADSDTDAPPRSFVHARTGDIIGCYVISHFDQRAPKECCVHLMRAMPPQQAKAIQKGNTLRHALSASDSLSEVIFEVRGLLHMDGNY